MDQHFLKITYHLGAKKMNAYIKMPSPTYFVLKKEIELCLFQDRQQPRSEIRTYWIDEDNDEIEIVNQCDYEIFMAKSSGRQHLQVAPIGMNTEDPVASTNTMPSTNSESTQTKVPPAAGSYDFAVHSSVECDSCLMSPIIGFRYKCIQCPNYDLCQNCEAKHIHSEHMMVRMPTNNCPNVIDAYVTGRTSGRKHGKRSKTSCPFVKNGISVAIDDDTEAAASTSAAENAQQSSQANGKERHHGRKHHRRQHRNNFFSNLYEMMHDLAEGTGTAAAAQAMGESDTSTKSTTFNSGTQTYDATNANGFANETNPIAAAAAAAAARMASQYAQDAATKAAEIAAKVASETASNVSKNVTENMTASASAAANENSEKMETSKENVDATTTADDANPQDDTVPVTPSPSLEGLAQFLDPQYVKTGIQILNNFSDMFAKMLDPMDDDESQTSQTMTNLEVISNKSSVSGNLNCSETEKKSGDEKSIDKNTNQEKPTDENAASNVVVDDLGSESENESISGSFVKLNVPTNNENQSNSTTSAEATPSKSMDKSNAVDFAQLSADLKAHIAQETEKESLKSTEGTKETTEKITDTVSEPVAITPPTSATTSDKPEEKRPVPVYHVDQRINNAVLAMMSMGFSNEGAWLTQLLESVNGNIPEALDLMSAAQKH